MVRPIRLAGSNRLHRWVGTALYPGSVLQCGYLDRVSDCYRRRTGGIRANPYIAAQVVLSSRKEHVGCE